MTMTISSPAATATEVQATSPLIILSYGYAGAELIQEDLSAATSVACTIGTGILPQCEAAATAWARIDGNEGTKLSALAAASLRALVRAQMMAILAGTGKQRWCELAASPPSAAEVFLQLFPQATFVCAHRSCAGFILACHAASPWGAGGPALRPFHLSYPGNAVAAMAAYWAAHTEPLLAFEAAHSGTASRVRYEDIAAAGQHASPIAWPSLGPLAAAPEPQPLPVEMIPAELRDRIDRLHATLGYPPLAPAPAR
jgi:hypothetical protein